MGCENSSMSNSGSSSSDSPTFGTGVHVGRAGNVDLAGRKMEFLGLKIVNMIANDDLHRTATSLTLTDNRLYTLGKELTCLPKLEEIDMDQNMFQRLPEIFTQMAMLWRINASSNPLDAQKGLDIAPRMESLRSITLCNCSFIAFPARLLECAKLEVLDLSDNPKMPFTNVNLASLPQLNSLNVANCGLKGNVLPIGIRRVTTMKALDISANELTFDSDKFFGHNLAATIDELHLRQLNLTAVPPIVVTLKKLNYLDLAENPIETLDVLAGRVVKRLPRVGSNGTIASLNAVAQHVTPVAAASKASGLTETSAGGGGSMPSHAVGSSPMVPGGASGVNSGRKDDDANSVYSDGRASTTSKMSMSKLSKAGMIAHVSTPLPVKKLSLRACNLRTVPKYFHKLINLEELDLSDNDQLDDPNMTLFSLQNLRVLNIVGCPFAVDPTTSRSEWFDMAKLNNLRELSWELWRGNHNTSPYRTRIPLEICGLRLQKINELKLRPNLFVGDTIETVTNLLRDGYFKVDLCIDDNTVYSYIDAVKIFLKGEQFFFPRDVHPPAVGGAKKEQKGTPTVHGKELGDLHLRISIHRYIFFLAMQAANYDAVIVPPLDVMIIHYAQLATNPVQYRLDCESVCGRILNCNYRTFFLEAAKNPTTAKDAVAASKRVWNLMVRSAQTDLNWLRYDFWEKRSRAIAAALHASAAGVPAESMVATSVTHTLPQTLIGVTTDAMFADFVDLRSIDSAHDLSGVLDQAITSHFLEQGDDIFRESVEVFYQMNHSFVAHEDTLRSLTLDWNRYVKYVALYSYHSMISKERNNTDFDDDYGSIPDNRRISSLLGPHYDAMENTSFTGPSTYLPQPNMRADFDRQRSGTGLSKRSSSYLSAAPKKTKSMLRVQTIQNMKVSPVPTVGLTLLIYAHRTTQVKYFQMLSLFGIEDSDITWADSQDIEEQTKRAWRALYDESYVGNSDCYVFRCSTVGVMCPMTEHHEMQGTMVPFANTPYHSESDYHPNIKPKGSSVRNPKASRDGDKHVLLCSADTEYGVF